MVATKSIPIKPGAPARCDDPKCTVSYCKLAAHHGCDLHRAVCPFCSTSGISRAHGDPESSIGLVCHKCGSYFLPLDLTPAKRRTFAAAETTDLPSLRLPNGTPDFPAMLDRLRERMTDWRGGQDGVQRVVHT